MAATLPLLPPEVWRRRLDALTPEPLPTECGDALLAHYEELRRWSSRLSLVGPGGVEGVLARHYGESLAALPLLRSTDRTLLDVGSGAGFPGLVLAAARPALRVILVEARARKWAFLKAAARRAGLSCACVNARVRSPLPEEIPGALDVVTSRAVKVEAAWVEPLVERNPGVRFLLWRGDRASPLPAAWTITRELRLSEGRGRIVEAGIRQARSGRSGG